MQDLGDRLSKRLIQTHVVDLHGDHDRWSAGAPVGGAPETRGADGVSGMATACAGWSSRFGSLVSIQVHAFTTAMPG